MEKWPRVIQVDPVVLVRWLLKEQDSTMFLVWRWSKRPHAMGWRQHLDAGFSERQGDIFFPLDPPMGISLLTPWLLVQLLVKLILGFFQNCDIRCFNPLGLWYFVITTLGNVYKYPGTNGHYFLVASNLPYFLTHPQTTPQSNPFCHLPENLIVPRVHSHPSLPWANTPNLVQSWVFCWVLMVGRGRPS